VTPTLVLVHGAWHGAWCWELLVPELERRGARAIAVDLPCADPTAGLARYTDVVLEAASDLEDVVLVGHSLGGITIPLVAAARPVRALVFLCGLVPVPGLSLSAQSEQEDIFPPGFGEDLARDEEGRSYWSTAEAALATFYADCPDDVARAAAARLRPQGRLPSTDPCPLEAWPDVPSVAIVARDDSAVDLGWARQTARARLGCEAVELPGGHSPFLARPAELAETLLGALA
jgi:pimeloyl-ACP methyl ester carboxylesterase